MRMGSVNIYLPDDIASRAKQLGINVSAAARRALQLAIDEASGQKRCECCGRIREEGPSPLDEGPTPREG